MATPNELAHQLTRVTLRNAASEGGANGSTDDATRRENSKQKGVCSACGRKGHKTPRSKKCSFHQPAPVPATSNLADSNDDQVHEPDPNLDEEEVHGDEEELPIVEEDADEEGQGKKTKAKEDKPPEWKKSKARDYLYGLLVRGELPDRKTITPRGVFDVYCKDRPEFKHFQDYTSLKFPGKLKYLRDMTEARSDRSKADAVSLAHDRLIFPAPLKDTMGRPMWAGSRAQKLLIEDIKNGVHETMKPKGLYESREEYNENYDQDFFREKIYQEVKALKRAEWVKAKAEAKKNKKK
jgi:hypothetical protein